MNITVSLFLVNNSYWVLYVCFLCYIAYHININTNILYKYWYIKCTRDILLIIYRLISYAFLFDLSSERNLKITYNDYVGK